MHARMIATGVVLFGWCVGCAGCAGRQSDSAPLMPPDSPVTLELNSKSTDVGADIFDSKQLLSNQSESAADGQSRLVTIGRGGVNFSVIFGGCDDGSLNKGTGTGMVVANSDPAWEVQKGYAMAWGWRPFIKTPQVVTGSDGTTVLVQIVRSGTNTESHRVVLIRGGPTEVSVKPGTAKKCDADNDQAVMEETELLLEPWTFVETTIKSYADGLCYELSDVKRLSAPANRDLRRFVREALKARRVQSLIAH